LERSEIDDGKRVDDEITLEGHLPTGLKESVGPV
jgi:hypothetical protein